jgi:hypothetical protein
MPISKGNTTWNEHVRNGEAFSAEDFIIGAVGLFPHLQLFNPVGSGIRVRLRSVHETMTVARVVNVKRYDPPGSILGPPAGFVLENLLGGGPAAIAEVRSNNGVASVGSPFWLVQSNANEPGIYPPRGQEWGHDLLPGQGIVLVSSTTNTTLIANWQWVELPL